MLKNKNLTLMGLEPTNSKFRVQGADHYTTISDAKWLSKNYGTKLDGFLFLYSKFHLPSTTSEREPRYWP